MSDPFGKAGTELAPGGYAWIHISGGPVVCYPSPLQSQVLAPFAESSKREAFHDETLAEATKQINGVIAGVNAGNSDPTRVPSLILVPGGQMMLVWAVAEHPVSAHSNPDEIRSALGLPPAKADS
jgi:hypothetical protein